MTIKQSTPQQSLEDQILSACVPKNEREWWACRHIKYLRDEVIAERNSDIKQLRQRVAELEKERDELIEVKAAENASWNAGFNVQADQIAKLTTERDSAYKIADHYRAERDALKQLYESSEESVLALKETRNRLAEERDALKQQRDELLAALGSGGRHCNDDTPHSNLCEAIIDSKEADLGQGLDPFWKWAFRRGFHEAETSYKVDIATLEQQRDELLAELEELSLYVAYNGDDWVQKKARAAIASVKEKA